MSNRLKTLQAWLTQQSALTHPFSLSHLAGDASFRQYYRLTEKNGNSWIVMDAPPDRENCGPFIQVAQLLLSLGLHVPRIEAHDLAQGFLLLEDFGDTLYHPLLSEESVDRLYQSAIDALIQLQTLSPLTNTGLPYFDKAFMQTELDNFNHWVVDRYLKLSLSSQAKQIMTDFFDSLLTNAVQQIQVCIHRDYHSRNLMLLNRFSQQVVGILDFQDAMWGPMTYDLVSLLKDCYIDWPLDRIKQWVYYFYEQSTHPILKKERAFEDFFFDFESMGCQRHLKASFIFARKLLRDNDPRYLEYLPRTFQYLLDVCRRTQAFYPFGELLENTLLPALNDKLSIALPSFSSGTDPQ